MKRVLYKRRVLVVQSVRCRVLESQMAVFSISNELLLNVSMKQLILGLDSVWFSVKWSLYKRLV